VPELPIVVVGMPAAVPDADLLVGGRRHLDGRPGRHLVIGGDLGPVLDAMAVEPGRICVLASGDPGFFGIVRALGERFGAGALDVRPAPSSVSLAFARLGLPWDDAVVVSAHGRPLRAAARRAAPASKAAVLTSPDSPPEALGKELLVLGGRHRRAVVCSQVGTARESLADTDLAGLAAGTWDPMSVVVLLDPAHTAPVLAWGAPEHEFAHRDGMITKSEVRAVALGKLGLPPAGVLWDVGAGSGSVAIECARLSPGLRVFAVDRDVERLQANVTAHGVAIDVVQGEAPAALAALPDPDRAFVGGGGLDVLEAVLARLAPGGRVVAAFAALDRAAVAAQRLGHMVQVGVARAAVLPDGGIRLAAENPVFVAWGPAE
jgi:precorrin-6Y C5,15-methyltransferase (decarboxylating)